MSQVSLQRVLEQVKLKMRLQILVVGDDERTKIEGIKVQVIAAFVGVTISVRSANTEERQLALPSLLANTEHTSGGNAIAKLLITAAGHMMYPQAPYSPDKRYRAAQIDAWIDHSTIELRQVVTKHVGSGSHVKLAVYVASVAMEAYLDSTVRLYPYCCSAEHWQMQGKRKDAAGILQSLQPLETLLSSQTYLVQNSLSLADVVVSLDLKHSIDTVRTRTKCHELHHPWQG